MAKIRSYRPSDLDALYDICLKTGDAGADGTALYRDPKILGDVYAAPYAAFAPECCFVMEDQNGVGGYIVGAPDTYAFETRLARDWWPALRVRHPDPGAGLRNADDAMARHIHHPPRTPRRIGEPYPAHLHINLLPRLQGRRLGAALIDRWRMEMARMGVRAAHLAVGMHNARAVRFYRAYGFKEVERIPLPFGIIFFGIAIDQPSG